MATNSLHLTTFSLQYTPPVVACVCIHLACKWSNWEIPVSTDGKPWWEYVDVTVTLELLDELTHEFLQILEKTPNRLKRIRNWRACQAAKKPKMEAAEEDEDEDEDEHLSEQTILSMISRTDSTVTGLMNLSASSAVGQDPGNTSGTGPAIPKVDSASGHRTANSVADHSLVQDTTTGHAPQKHNTKNLSSSKVSLKEYRAKHAEELAAQKRQLENMEASVKEQYAYAAQNLLVQQKRDKEHEARHQESVPSTTALKTPVTGSENPERPPSDKAALKLRIPMSVSGAEKPPSLKPDEIKVRIKMPPAVRHSSSDETASKSKERHKSSSLNHHHHHHHHNHSHKHSHSQPAGASKRPSDSKSSSLQSSSVHKSYGLPSQSRKRPLSEELSTHDLASKISKSSKSSNITFPFPNLPTASAAHVSDPTDLAYSQSSYRVKSSHMKSDKNSAGANGHSASQAMEYQDTVNMLHSLLSAQGMQPTQPPAFQFVHNYGEYRISKPSVTSRTGTTDKLQAPPLPSEPPPPLPPLPK
nr:cyclin-T1 isoform X2 [Geotrypetes seraphini]